jgi:hypothetical protein
VGNLVDEGVPVDDPLGRVVRREAEEGLRLVTVVGSAALDQRD